MQLETALRVFGLHPNPTTDELNRAFRRLAKRYHPDSNADRVEWATSHMTSINLAYETIRRYIENGDANKTTGHTGRRGHTNTNGSRSHRDSRRQTGGEDHRSSRYHADANNPNHGSHSSAGRRTWSRNSSTSSAARPTGAHAGRRSTESPSTQALREFDEARQRILEGIGVYYQFGLENFRLRHDGPHRLKYRKATRLVMKGLDRFAELWTRHGPLADNHRITRFYAFASLFYRCMFLEHDVNPYATKYNRNAYQHFRYGSTLLDETIRDTLFPGMTGRAFEPIGHLQVAWREFSAVIGQYPESGFVDASRLKQSLTEVYMDFLGS